MLVHASSKVLPQSSLAPCRVYGAKPPAASAKRKAAVALASSSCEEGLTKFACLHVLEKHKLPTGERLTRAAHHIHMQVLPWQDLLQTKGSYHRQALQRAAHQLVQIQSSFWAGCLGVHTGAL